MTVVSYPRRLADLADRQPDRTAITCADATVSRAELERRAIALAGRLRADGVGEGDMVTIALPNSIEWFVAVVAAWKLGAIPQPVSSRLPGAELAAIVALADPPVVVGAEPGSFAGRACYPSHDLVADQSGAGRTSDPPEAELDLDIISPSWKAPTSGGSTGRPKLIVAGTGAVLDDEAPPALLVSLDGCLVMPGPLYHNGPIVWSCAALLAGSHVVLLPHFDAEATLVAIERHRADIVYLVPTMMRRIWRLPEAIRDGYDLDSLRVVWHLAEPCPPWLKDAWIDWLGPERIFELYGGTEGQAVTIITGSQWLEHRGSVGRPTPGTVVVCDADGVEVPPDVEGEIWMRSTGRTPPYRYVGAEARTRDGGWESLGDMGWVDADGYLYLGDRMTDMILTGGANVYPAEIEAAVQEHPQVRSCAVIGLPDDDLGQRVHAVVEADADALDPAELITFLGERLARYKVPRTVELVGVALRDDAGKVRRSALRAERLGE